MVIFGNTLNLFKIKIIHFKKNKYLKSLSKKEIDDAYKSSIKKWEKYSPTPFN